ncbi:DUF4380 domain-containing protein [Rhodococcus sp. ARC_M5]|uniref:DUF4380 domain-containing protein n=1 Tax=Rhodococcus sp. ARC_M5 TaxID=2928851 RepID=UPI001FB1E860|nr:DUF4380 domain-containing protein [Rhodococcus sp. ARC_M5]MCJ0893782.1 DUF4380 domain-containing protein [Rhodococcus sp. ARC_M5]
MHMPAEVATEIDEGGGSRPDVVWIDNAVLRLGFVPALGGRLLSMRMRGQELLWRNASLLDDALHPVGSHVPEPVSGAMSLWNNYGGDKTWPAPQGWSASTEWAGPPDPVLDSGYYDWTVDRTDKSTTVTMTSGHDPRTGLTVTRAVSVTRGQSAYDVHLSAQNTSENNVRWALWNVTQRAGGEPGSGGVDIGIEPGDHRTVELAVGTGAPRVDTLGTDRLHVAHQDVVGKVGVPGASGWLAHSAFGTTATQTFTVDPTAEYPDQGSRVEVWMEHPLTHPITHLGGLHPSARIVEIELLGPSTALAPGDRTDYRYRSGVSEGSGDVRAVTSVGHWEGDDRFCSYISGHLVVDGEAVASVRAGDALTIAVVGDVMLRDHTGTDYDVTPARKDTP